MVQLSQEQVFEQIKNMRDQKISFRDIAKHLQGIGYTSHLTKRPLGEQAIRNIVGKLQGDKKKAEKADRKSEAIYLSKKKSSIQGGIRAIVEAKEFTDDLKVKFIDLLLKEA